MKRWKTLGAVLVAASAACCQSYAATLFLFGNGGIQNSIAGLANADVQNGSVTMTLTAGPDGSRFDDSDEQGLGVDSVDPSMGIADPDRSKVNLITALPPGTKTGEAISFSFNRPGILHDLLFDGIKDETLEYFSLTLPNGHVMTIFDSQTSFRLGIQNYALSDLNLANPVECQTEDDDLTGIDYRYQAGQVFTLTYGEGDYGLVPNYRTNPRFPQFPNSVGDGCRFQGVNISDIPEPSTTMLLLPALGFIARRPVRRNEVTIIR